MPLLGRLIEQIDVKALGLKGAVNPVTLTYVLHNRARGLCHFCKEFTELDNAVPCPLPGKRPVLTHRICAILRLKSSGDL